MQQRYEDCTCEDYPCCGHYDILYGDEQQANYCDDCGGYHSINFDCSYDPDEDEWVDEDDGIDHREDDNDLNYERRRDNAYPV